MRERVPADLKQEDDAMRKQIPGRVPNPCESSLHRKRHQQGKTVFLTLLLGLAVCLSLEGCVSKETDSPVILKILPTTAGGGAITDSSGNLQIDPLQLADGNRADIAPDLGLLSASVMKTGSGSMLEARAPGESGPVTCVFFNLRVSPGSDPAFRHALALAVDREGIVDRSTVPLVQTMRFAPSTLQDWDVSDAVAPSFDSGGAVSAFDAAGYLSPPGSSGHAKDKSGTRLDPTTGKPLAIRLLTPTKETAPSAWETGRTLADTLNDMGVTTAHVALSEALLSKATMQQRAFDLLVTEVALAQRPFGLYPLLHSSRDTEWTNAFSGIRNNELDDALEMLWTGNDEPTAQAGSKRTLSRLSELLPYIPVCTRPNRMGFWGTDQPRVPHQRGNDDAGTWAGIRVSDDAESSSGKGVLTLAAAGGLLDLNPLTAHGADEWRVLRLINLPLLEASDGPGLARPILAEKWEIGEWTGADGSPHTKITLNLRAGVKWQDGTAFTAHDIAFMITAVQTRPDANFHTITNRIDEVEVKNDRTLTIWFNDLGCRCLFDLAWFSLLPEHLWKDAGDPMTYHPWEKASPTTKGMTELVGNGIWRLSQNGLAEGRLDKGVSLERVPGSETLLRLLGSSNRMSGTE